MKNTSYLISLLTTSIVVLGLSAGEAHATVLFSDDFNRGNVSLHNNNGWISQYSGSMDIYSNQGRGKQGWGPVYSYNTNTQADDQIVSVDLVTLDVALICKLDTATNSYYQVYFSGDHYIRYTVFTNGSVTYSDNTHFFSGDAGARAKIDCSSGSVKIYVNNTLQYTYNNASRLSGKSGVGSDTNNGNRLFDNFTAESVFIPTHKECSNISCITVTGEGTDSCTTDLNCQHKACVNYQCTIVSGAGSDSCSMSPNDCPPAPTPIPTPPPLATPTPYPSPTPAPVIPPYNNSWGEWLTVSGTGAQYNSWTSPMNVTTASIENPVVAVVPIWNVQNDIKWQQYKFDMTGFPSNIDQVAVKVRIKPTYFGKNNHINISFTNLEYYGNVHGPFSEMFAVANQYTDLEYTFNDDTIKSYFKSYPLDNNFRLNVGTSWDGPAGFQSYQVDYISLRFHYSRPFTPNPDISNQTTNELGSTLITLSNELKNTTQQCLIKVKYYNTRENIYVPLGNIHVDYLKPLSTSYREGQDYYAAGYGNNFPSVRWTVSDFEIYKTYGSSVDLMYDYQCINQDGTTDNYTSDKTTITAAQIVPECSTTDIPGCFDLFLYQLQKTLGSWFVPDLQTLIQTYKPLTDLMLTRAPWAYVGLLNPDNFSGITMPPQAEFIFPMGTTLNPIVFNIDTQPTWYKAIIQTIRDMFGFMILLMLVVWIIKFKDRIHP